MLFELDVYFLRPFIPNERIASLLVNIKRVTGGLIHLNAVITLSDGYTHTKKNRSHASEVDLIIISS